MPKKDWYIFKESVTFGPLPTEVVQIMIEQKRVKVTEFIWCERMDRWERIRDVPEFADEWKLPPYPVDPIPSEQGLLLEVEIDGEKSKKKRKKITSSKKAKGTAKAGEDPDVEAVSDGEDDMAPPKESTKEWNIRRSPRVAIRGKVDIQSMGIFELVDISETGLLVRTDAIMTPGTNLEYTLIAKDLSSDILRMTGVVARKLIIGNSQHVGIEFTRVNPAYKRILSDYIGKNSLDE